MPGAGTDKTKRWIEQPAPVVVLVEPQMAENIGAVARAMANFGLSRLRLVKPLQVKPFENCAARAGKVAGGVPIASHIGRRKAGLPPFFPWRMIPKSLSSTRSGMGSGFSDKIMRKH